MELEDLKNIWQRGDSFSPKQEEEIAQMIRRRSRSIISKLERNIWFELSFTLVATLVLGYYAIKIPGGAMRWAYIAFVILFIGYIIYYIKKIMLLRKFEGSTQNIRENLKKLINDLSAYLQFYNTSYRLFYPIFLVLICAFIILERGWDEFLTSLQDWKMIVYLVFLAVLFLTSSLWLTQWYLFKLYGRHLRKLRQLLADLDDATGIPS